MEHIDLIPHTYFKRWGRLYYIEKVTSQRILVEDCFTEVKTELDIVVLLEPDVERVRAVVGFGTKARQMMKV